MENSQPSFGSGSAILGGAQNVTQAMPMPGAQNVMQHQVSPASAIYQPGIQVPQQPQMPQGGDPMSMFGMQASLNPASQQQQQPAQPQQPNAPQPKGESNSIIEALTNRLKDIAKLERTIYGVM